MKEIEKNLLKSQAKALLRFKKTSGQKSGESKQQSSSSNNFYFLADFKFYI